MRGRGGGVDERGALAGLGAGAGETGGARARPRPGGAGARPLLGETGDPSLLRRGDPLPLGGAGARRWRMEEGLDANKFAKCDISLIFFASSCIHANKPFEMK